MEWTKLMKLIDKCHMERKKIIVYWENGLVQKCASYTGVFESDNGLEMDEEDYLDYDCALLDVIEIIAHPNDGSEVPSLEFLIEVSELYEPLEVRDEDLNLLWSKGD